MSNVSYDLDPVIEDEIILQNEGVLFIRVRKRDNKPDNEIDPFDGTVGFRHSCTSVEEDERVVDDRGVFVIRKNYDKKNNNLFYYIFFCQECGLRFTIPSYVKNKHDLIKFLTLTKVF